MAIKLSDNMGPSCPNLFRMALGYNPIPHSAKTDLGIADLGIANLGVGSVGNSLLHAAAVAVGQVVCDLRWFDTEESQRDRILGWKSIIQDLVTLGADLHACDDVYLDFGPTEYAKSCGQLTPLKLMLARLLYSRLVGSRYRADAGEGVSIWISALYDSGVNLEEYGLKESSTWSNLEEYMGC